MLEIEQLPKKGLRKLATSDSPLSTNPGKCLYELIVTQVFIARTPLSGTTMLASFTFRDFSSGKLIRTTGMAKNSAKHFTMKSSMDLDAAKADLSRALGADLEEFAAKKARTR